MPVVVECFNAVSHPVASRYSFASDEDFDPTVFDADFVGLDALAGASQTVAGREIEAPSVPVAFDRPAAEISVGERRAPVRAEVFDGVEAAFDVVEGEFRPVFEFDGRAAPVGHVFDAADGDERARARGSLRVLIFVIEGLHYRRRA